METETGGCWHAVIDQETEAFFRWLHLAEMAAKRANTEIFGARMYSPDQPRDDQGQWGEGGGSGTSPSLTEAPKKSGSDKPNAGKPSSPSTAIAGPPADVRATEGVKGRAARSVVDAGAPTGNSHESLVASDARQKALLERLHADGTANVERNDARKIGSGAEHTVELSEDGKRVIKHTNAGRFGYVLSGEDAPMGSYTDLREATPHEYLHRIDASNKLFGDDVRVEGVSRGPDGKIGLVTSQKNIVGTHPTQQQVDSFLKKKGFVKAAADASSNDYIGDKTWSHSSGYVVADTKPDNFKMDAKGRIHPVDVLVQYAAPGSSLRKALKIK